MIGVKNMIKKNKEVLEEIKNNENRIEEVCKQRKKMINDGKFDSEEIKKRNGNINDKWKKIKEKDMKRKKEMED